MYVPEGEIGYRIYWEDIHGQKNELFVSALTKEEAINQAIEYIKNNLYIGSFTIVGLEQRTARRWEMIEINSVWCKGR